MDWLRTVIDDIPTILLFIHGREGNFLFKSVVLVFSTAGGLFLQALQRDLTKVANM